MTAPVSSSSSDSSAAAAAAAAEAARRAIEAAAREAARRAEQAREAAKAQAKTPAKPPVPQAPSRFEVTPKPKVELDPKSKKLSPEQTQAYVTAAKAITKKDPSADPHQLIAQNPDLVSWIEQSSRDLEGARGRSAASQITAQQTELDSRLVVSNGYAMLADNRTEAAQLEKNPIMDPDSARAALQPLMPNDTGPSAQERAQAAKAAEFGKRLVEASKEAEAALPGSGYCATGVSNALAKLGIDVGGNGNEIDNNLPRDQFKQVDMSLEDALKIPGAILTWEKTSTAAGSLYGHTAITWGDGHTSSSDFTETDTVAGSTERTGLKVFVPTGMALDGQDVSPVDSLTSSKVQKIMPDVSDDEAKRLTPVLKDAMTAAKIEKPESAAAFMAMMAQGTKQFSQSEPEAMQFIVDSAKTWRANGESLDKSAQAGRLNQVARQLGVEVPKPDSASSDPAQPETKQDWLRWGAAQIGVEPMELAAIIDRESGFDPNADNGIGYHGLIQMGDGAQGETGYDPAADGTFEKQMPKIVDYFKGRGFDGSQYSDPTERTMHAYATVLGGNPDAVDSSDGNGSPRDVVGDMVNPGGQYYDAAKDFMGSNTSAWGGKSQVGQSFYDRGLQAFGASQPDGAGAAPSSTSASSSGAVSSASGVSSAPTSSASSPATSSAPEESAATQQVDAVQRQAQSYGYDIGQQNLAAILQMLNGSYDAILSGLSDDPDFAAFVKSQPGMKNWRPGRPVPKAMVAAFLSKKMKSHGVKANEKGELVDKKGHALDGWKDVSKALGIKGSKPGDEPSADPFALDNPFVVDGSATTAAALNPVTRV